MSIPVTSISAEDKIDNIECHFKVSAGPGAGKTRWLINHIQNVLHNSKRLGNTRKIACITYTNVAAETILERLGNNDGSVEVSTFHSFLYKHIIKSFSFLIPTEYQLDITRVDGHDEMPIYKGWLFEWKKNTGQNYLTDDSKIVTALKDLAWQFDSSNNLVLKTKKTYTGKISATVSIRNNSYIEYKKMYWSKGILDHEDVLFFSYILITQNPRILTVIRAKFPYLFIDEFQDTNPIQTVIIKKIAEEETITGVIGDIAQSIYGFQGADPNQFRDFAISGIQNYTIADNHRSTIKITKLLNAIRSDITQDAKRNIDGNVITILIGDKIWALSKASELASGKVYSLTRDNVTSNVMRDKSTFEFTHKKLIEELREVDSNSQRMHLVSACIRATEYARQYRYKDALKEISKELKKIEEKIDIQKVALNILKSLLSKYDSYKSQTLLTYKSELDTIYPVTISNLRTGAIKTFYESHTYEQAAICVNIKEDSSHHRTIHKAKGAEFDNVILVLDKKNKTGAFEEAEDLGFLIAPDLQNNEEHRVRYVGVSRARENLFINVPTLSASSNTKLSNMGFNIIQE